MQGGIVKSEVPHLFCFGLGYTAKILARALKAQGWRISGTVRSPEKLASLNAQGFDTYLFGNEHPLTDAEKALAGVSHVLVTQPPGEFGDPVLHLERDVLLPLAPQWRWLGYLSATGVYGDRGGEWVDETAPLRPLSQTGKRRAAAEGQWREFAEQTGVPLHIFRIAGIYGPTRNPLEQLRAGRARRIEKPGQVFSRIHVEDLAAVLAASMLKPDAGGAIYNICDDEPAPHHEVVAYAARLLGMEPPPLEPFFEAAKTMKPKAQRFYNESKRVSNARMKEALGIRLRYPTYREGLTALCGNPWATGFSVRAK